MWISLNTENHTTIVNPIRDYRLIANTVELGVNFMAYGGVTSLVAVFASAFFESVVAKTAFYSLAILGGGMTLAGATCACVAPALFVIVAKYLTMDCSIFCCGRRLL